MRPSAAWCRRSPPAPMSRRWTASSRRPRARPASRWPSSTRSPRPPGPGLIGGLIVGLMTAKAIAAARGKPLIAVNHLEGHALTARLTDGLRFPYLLLLVSGGHTQLVLVAGVGDYERWAPPSTMRWARPSTRRRSCSACPIPAARMSSSAAAPAIPRRFALPRPLKGAARLRFLLLRPEDGGAPGGRQRSRRSRDQRRRRYLRRLPGRRRRHARRTASRRALARFRATSRSRAARAGRRRRRRRQPRDPRQACKRSARGARLRLRRAAARRSAPTMPP